MANDCGFTLKVCGSPDNIREFIKYLTNEYDEGRHFWRMFEIYTHNPETIEEGFAEITGVCAWSIYSCMFDGPNTYQYDANKSGEHHLGITLEEATKNLDLLVEIFSAEQGIGFEEHVLVEKGDIIIQDCTDYTIYDYYSIICLYNEEFDTDYQEDDATIVDKVLKWFDEEYRDQYEYGWSITGSGMNIVYTYSEQNKDFQI